MAICPECGVVVPNGTRFCTSCGTKVDLSESRRPVSERVPKQAGGQEKVIVQPSRAERQRRPITPIDEHRPMPGDMPPRNPSLQQEFRAQRERAGREQPPLFDDDEFYESKQPNRAAREVQQERPRAEELRSRQSTEDLRPRQDVEERSRQRTSAQPRSSQPRPQRQSQVPVLGTMEYLLSILVLIVPVVGLVMGFLWSRGASNPNKRNLCNAMVILNVVEIVAFGIYALFKWVL